MHSEDSWVCGLVLTACTGSGRTVPHLQQGSLRERRKKPLLFLRLVQTRNSGFGTHVSVGRGL
ncbi:hypothetical protein PF005_g8356 [Phytophthora fragariae]|uniref:Uncharacterized protein n=1 Tax=Phytophthora fragariae TaxID=53985 RepID=A0A6A4A8M2_9STRA|nr:hypothetical protein PF003_g2082 [Phytophthora fragariae]KAE8947479.1 hypothetical protein PF009_g2902 [Phytophthora fragariae]KAE9119175.1 hypothetical protein PF007_g8650 [Phytophthora fragariae]KAE9119362.1 hypothetical protein PF010_g7891 [Phytophthora fragariae]KAE9147755.1 hypothetical protein PF006_g7593 [Phytophthora fragariae]